MRLLETIRASLTRDDNPWRPLTLDTFFTEGWREPWAGGPAGQSGLTPRHGWLGSFEGVFYRLWLVNGSYMNGVTSANGDGSGYSGGIATFLPLSRRLELYINAPLSAPNGSRSTGERRTEFGDVQVAASFLLSETEATTHLFTLGATLPTGEAETGGGLTTIFPRYSFWTNPGGAWVVRGGTGLNIPVNESAAASTFNGNMAVGRYFRPHDVPFGDFVLYVNTNIVTPIDDSDGPTYVGVGPGTRFQITGNWYFLNYWEAQVSGEKPFDYQTQLAIVKAW
jgi:hypothetical protein